MNLLPNYFVIGAAKAASSSVCTLLGLHPDIFMVDCKEPCFFNDDAKFNGLGWTWYESLYLGSESCARRGEGSNRYSMKELWPNTAQRIAESCPNSKILYLVREPFSRIESVWMQMRSNGSIDAHPNFNEAVLSRPDIFVDSTNYQSQLAVYRDLFPPSQIHVVFYEDFRHDATATMKRIFEFLEVRSDVELSEQKSHLNASEGKLVFSDGFMRIRRAKYLQPLKKLLPDHWKQKMAERFFRVPMSGRPVWREGTRAFVTERLLKDSRELLVANGKPMSYWPFCTIR